MPRAEILSQGDEVVTGQIADTNAAWLSERLIDCGFDVARHTAVGDRLPDLVALLQEASARAELLICTGGLGPTEDDLTAEAVSIAADRPLAFDPEAWEMIQAMFARFNRQMPESNRRQAMLPHGALRLDNDRGTAPGFLVGIGAATLVCMPGVPHEMMAMFERVVLPELTQRFALRPGRLVTLRTTGLGESAIAERIGTFTEPGFVLGYRTTPGENLVKLRIDPDVPEARIRAVASDLHTRIGSSVFATDGLGAPGGPLVEVVARLLLDRGATLAVAESCTGGRIAATCTALAGASGWLIEGVVAYANAAKARHLGVPEPLLEAHGAVSEPVARAMAEGVRLGSGATFGLATTGVAGPSGGSELKPVGLVHLALATPNGTFHRLARFGGDRARIQAHASAAALDLLRRHLQQLSLA